MNNIITPDMLNDINMDYTTKIEDWNNLKVEIKNKLNLEEMMSFVKFVVGLCFDENGYHPELLSFAKRHAMVSYYTNIELPSDSVYCFDILTATSLTDIISTNINLDQYKDIENIITEQISYNLSSMSK